MQIATHGILAASASAAAPSFSNTKSIDLDGVDDFVDCGDPSNLSFGDGSTDSPFTFSAWVKVDDLSTRHSLIKKGDFSGSNNREYYIYIDTDGSIKNNIYSNGVTLNRRGRKTSTGLISANTWYHIAFTYDGQGGTNASDGIKIYLDGVRVDNANNQKNIYVAMKNTSFTFRIGQFTNGKMDEVAVFNSELSASNVTSIYNSGSPADLTSLSPISWWRNGDGDTFPTLNDNGSGSNNGTMTNMTSGDIVTDVP